MTVRILCVHVKQLEELPLFEIGGLLSRFPIIYINYIAVQEHLQQLQGRRINWPKLEILFIFLEGS